MSVNQAVRSVGFSFGSAVGGLVLAAATTSERRFPTNAGYTAAAWVGAAAMTITAVTSLTIGRTNGQAGTSRTS